MIRLGIIGVGRMGLSHLAIANAHPDVEVAFICDKPGPITEALKAYTAFPRIGDYQKAIAEGGADALIVATPTGTHGEIVRAALDAGQHVFVEKPFCLDADAGESLAALAEAKGLVNQVGYHNRYVGTFQEAQRLLAARVLGQVHHVHGEAYGPVVTRPQSGTWRFSSKEEGGCLLDYASHVIDLIHFTVGRPVSVSDTVLQKIHSKTVEDAVNANLQFTGGMAGQLSVNWSDPSYRKMSTKITVEGEAGRIVADAVELRVDLNEACPEHGLEKGENIRYVTELTDPVWFYLRGEEYSAQIAAFVRAIDGDGAAPASTFKTAAQTDRVIAMLRQNGDAGAGATRSIWREWLARLFGGRGDG